MSLNLECQVSAWRCDHLVVGKTCTPSVEVLQFKTNVEEGHAHSRQNCNRLFLSQKFSQTPHRSRSQLGYPDKIRPSRQQTSPFACNQETKGRIASYSLYFSLNCEAELQIAYVMARYKPIYINKCVVCIIRAMNWAAAVFSHPFCEAIDLSLFSYVCPIFIANDHVPSLSSAQ